MPTLRKLTTCLLFSFFCFAVLPAHSIPPSAATPNASTTKNRVENASQKHGSSVHRKKKSKKGFWKRLQTALPTFSRNKQRIATENPCDRIVLKSGSELEGKVQEIGTQTITYKKCDWPEGPNYTLGRNDVDYIVFSNGEKEIVEPMVVQNDLTETPAVAHSKRQIRSLSVSSFVLVVVGLGAGTLLSIEWLLFLAIAGFVLGIFALAKARRDPKGTYYGFAIAAVGIVTGIVVLGLLSFFNIV